MSKKKSFSLLIPSFMRNYSLVKSMVSHAKEVEFVNVFSYPDGEIGCNLNNIDFLREDVKILLMQGEFGINSSIMSFFIICDALKRKFTNIKIEAIIPYIFYSRQDRITAESNSIGGRLFLDMIGSMGVHSIISVDAHFSQIQGFFSGRLRNLSAISIFAEDLKNLSEPSICVAPDLGAAKRTVEISKAINLGDIAVIVKERLSGGGVNNLMIVGDVKNKHCIIFDDIVDGGSTLCKAAESLKINGASKVSAYVTHPVLSSKGGLIDNNEFLDSIVFTNTIESTKLKKSKILDAARLFLDIIDNE